MFSRKKRVGEDGRKFTKKVRMERADGKKRAQGEILVGMKEGIGMEKNEGVNWIEKELVEIKVDMKNERWTVLGLHAYGNLEVQLRNVDEREEIGKIFRLKIIREGGGGLTQGLKVREDGTEGKKEKRKRRTKWRTKKGKRW